LFQKTASEMRRDKGLKKSASLRDAMDRDDLGYTMVSEMLAAERIEEEVCHGTDECREASRRSASFIRGAIEADRADRNKRRLV
ncbi:hypothetical protein, partial [Parvibaculum sp.]|uniref:hypothetical protein n=1 Tax=Parvibaculum sp. TaxID=2024848 RepID=UPI003C72C966